MKNIEISNALLRELTLCYDPSEIMPEDEFITLKEAIIKYRNSVRSKDDVIRVVCSSKFMSERELRLFAIWCAREALKLVETPESASIEACNAAEQHVNGKATDEELCVAWNNARTVALAISKPIVRDKVIENAVWAAVWAAWLYTNDFVKNNLWCDAKDGIWIAGKNAICLAGESDISGDSWDKQIDQLLTYFED